MASFQTQVERRTGLVAGHLLQAHSTAAATTSSSSTNNRMNSFFEHVPEAPADPILGVSVAYQADTHPNKLNLGVGAYRTDEGKPLVLNCVKIAEQRILNSGANKEYLPIEGLAEFNKAAQRLVFGELAGKLSIVTTQSISGTGALRIGMGFIKAFLPGATIYISDPTWGNHFGIAKDAGVPHKTYRYFNAAANKFDFDGMCEDIKAAPAGSVILLHACAHNPTGSDPTADQWQTIANIIKEKRHLTFFDTAYQGFASGDLDRDAHPIRLFASMGLQCLVSQSFAKNLGLYSERIGAFHAVCANEKEAKFVLSQLKIIIRVLYSNPPVHGARIAAAILNDPELFKEWLKELKEMSDRIKTMRQMLYDAIKANGTKGDWTNIITQIGMFSYTGLTPTQCDALTSKYHIYLTRNGRISMPGLSTKTVKYLADAIHDVVSNVQ